MKVKPRKPHKYRSKFILDIYDFAKAGASDTEIAREIGVTRNTFALWVTRYSAVRAALKRGRTSLKNLKTGDTLTQYIYQRLPANLQKVWKDLNRADKRKSAVERVKQILHGHGNRTQQVLFVHALISSSFNKNKAMRKIGITRDDLRKWEKDPDFVELMVEVDEIQKDWIDGQLMAFVASGDLKATMFVARAKLADRGYNPVKTVVNEGKVLHGHVDVTKVMANMSLDSQRELLKSLREQNSPPPIALPVHRDENEKA